jgi:hypothetical protein
LTLPSAVQINAIGIQGYASNIITFAASGTYEFEFVTSDNGSSITINEVNKKISPFNNSSDLVADLGTISLGTTYSYFDTAGTETCDLNDGVEGQIKSLVMIGYVGNMDVGVDSAGWSGGSGIITFDAVGDGCTLVFLNGSWWCIGNNGCVFS